MSIKKQIQEKFWQNDFVLGLQPEERYFYMYLITNTMTSYCGIYKFNIKLAELETGLSPEVIERHLKTFETYGKLILSKTTKEIMIVNWFKHNFKANKKTIGAINRELKDVKDKEFLKLLHEICIQRQYPVGELFAGIMTTDKIKADPIREEAKLDVQATSTVTPVQVKEPQEIVQAVPVESKETEDMIFTGFADTPTKPKSKGRKRKRKEEVIEENVAELVDGTYFDDEDEPFIGIPIATWYFTDSGGDTQLEGGEP
ncbi:hypothetical protein [Clostridium thermarum]|uniref:hypothetical protein n=1 Tax=Clostridium thermarum TaxID=1716543 RepID=UPI0013D52A15|nr:hypothetical protein [Clostridium thermarum]